jgi:FdhE protein
VTDRARASEIAHGAPSLRLPDPGLVFDARAARLRALAEGHPAGDWLLLLSRVAAGQRAAVREVRVFLPPAADAGPPLAADRLVRDGAWRRMLGVILSAARAPGLPAETVEALRRLAESDDARLEALADRVIAGTTAPEDVAVAPFVGAALQAWFGALAANLDPGMIALGGEGCPVCGSPAVAGMVQGDDRRRFLACALCAAEWYAPRLRCTRCGDEASLAYLHVEGDEGAKAEACGRCRAYVKLFDLEKRPGAEPAADDAATLALDLLVGEEGYERAGANPYVAVAPEG